MEENEDFHVLDDHTRFLMPFLDQSVEEEFLAKFNHDQLPYDRLMSIVVMIGAATFLPGAGLLSHPQAIPGLEADINFALLLAAICLAPVARPPLYDGCLWSRDSVYTIYGMFAGNLDSIHGILMCFVELPVRSLFLDKDTLLYVLQSNRFFAGVFKMVRIVTPSFLEGACRDH